MAIKKSELYSKLWASCDELRGGMDASQYKDYVLVLLFIKYVSDKYAGKKDAPIEVPKGGSFDDLIELKNKKDIGDKINIAIKKLAQANDLVGVIDVADFNNEERLGNPKDMVVRLTKLIGIFQDLNLAGNKAEGDDLLGDAYEYLMRHFATQSGKSKGQFYTPSEVSRIMAKVIGLSDAKRADQSIYDPTCGSGSLLLKAHDEAPRELTLFGQEMDNATRALAKMNMILHGCPDATILRENTLSTPLFKDPKTGKLKLFDFIVANPPFSTKSWTSGFNPAEDEYKRFEYGIPPQKNGDYAFLLHIIASLKPTGKGAIILPHGVLFRGGAEGVIRKNLITQGFVKGIIGLPANLFYGTSIPACIIIIDKEDASNRKGIFMIDASQGFIKDGNKNRLRAQDIHKIVDVFNNQTEIEKYSRLIPISEISDSENDFNLNISRYIDSSKLEDLQDISGHLNGGIPDYDLDALGAYWKAMPNLRDSLFERSSRKGYSNQLVKTGAVKKAIFENPEFKSYNIEVQNTFNKWRESNLELINKFNAGDKPKEIISVLAENLLSTFEKTPLIDAYDIYQHLMDYWSQTMQDDCYLIAQDGWVGVIDKKPNTDLIPTNLLVKRFFETESKALEELLSECDSFTRQMEELAEEHGSEDGLLNEAKNDKGKITKLTAKARLAEIKADKDAAEEKKLLEQFLELNEKESAANKKIKDAQKDLDTKVAAQYSKIKEPEIKDLVINFKWLAAIEASIHAELDRVSQTLGNRIKSLAERYEKPLPLLEKELLVFSARVDDHLKKMGFAWR